MLLRRGLVFGGLVVGHYLTSHVAFFFCIALYVRSPAPVVFYVFFFPALLSEATGAGVVPSSEWSIVDTPWAMEVNSLLWVAAVSGSWVLLQWTVRVTAHATRGASGGA
jgi:hypothetical protein